MNIKKWINKSIYKLSNVDNPQLDSIIILKHVLHVDYQFIILNQTKILQNVEIKKLKKYLIRRYLREPIAYIIKKKEFWSINFIVSKKIFIPRPDTEILVETALFLLKEKKKKY